MRREAINLTWNDYHDLFAELARREFLDFILYTKPDFRVNWHHKFIASKLQDFIYGKIKRLMIFLPTQVGKSEIGTRRLPPYLLGKYPDRNVGVISANDTKAKAFNVNVQKIIDSEKYKRIFPDTRLGSGKDKCKRTENVFQIVGHNGGLESYGINGPAAGSSFYYLILDDVIKNRQDACSLAIQKRNNNNWDSVLKLRLDNDSQILALNTRWDEDDLVGYILKSKEFDFEIIIFPALKVDDNNPDDPRKIGEALWPEKHSRERYEAQRLANPVVFEALQQQNPGVPPDILVYPKPWKQIIEMPDYSHFYGLDLGYSIAPDCLVECMLNGGRAYLRELFYDTGNDTDSLANKIKAAGAEKGPVYVDKSQPRLIEDMQIRGVNAKAAVGGPNSLKAGIIYLQSLDIHLTADSINAWLEKKKYQWPVGSDNRPLKGADPIDNYNHFMDAARYGLYSYSIEGGIVIYESKGDYY